MSNHHRNSSTYKPLVPEIPLDDYPSDFDTALNGNGNGNANGHTAKDDYLVPPEAFGRLSSSTVGGISSDGRSSRSPSRHSDLHARSPAPTTLASKWRGRFDRFWQRNRGLYLVAAAQLFGALMNVTTRSLELESGMHPFQILFARMGLTALGCIIYMRWVGIPDAPFGPRGVRGLLVARGLTGFFGIFGMYYSLQYLPVAEATVITFLAPGVAGLVCWALLGEKFTKQEMAATAVALAGVVLIARPASFFGSADPDAASMAVPANSTATATGDEAYHAPVPTSGQRLGAIGVALIGVLGAAGAYTTIRWIGKRAHPLISINYFSTWCTLVSTVVLLVSSLAPRDSPFYSAHRQFQLPAGLREWGMLLFLGFCGFVMQFMLTAGLAHEKSNRASNMVYTQMLFALLFDRWIFGTVMSAWSVIGSVLILGSALYIAVLKAGDVVKGEESGVAGSERRADEEVGMLEDVEGEERGRREDDGAGEHGRRAAGQVEVDAFLGEDIHRNRRIGA
jgi:drug/metabolite transporter (DMT)-like permease